MIRAEVSRCKSSDNVGAKTAATTPPPSRSSDNVNTMGEILPLHNIQVIEHIPNKAEMFKLEMKIVNDANLKKMFLNH